MARHGGGAVGRVAGPGRPTCSTEAGPPGRGASAATRLEPEKTPTAAPVLRSCSSPCRGRGAPVVPRLSFSSSGLASRAHTPVEPFGAGWLRTALLRAPQRWAPHAGHDEGQDRAALVQIDQLRRVGDRLRARVGWAGAAIKRALRVRAVGGGLPAPHPTPHKDAQARTFTAMR